MTITVESPTDTDPVKPVAVTPQTDAPLKAHVSPSGLGDIARCGKLYQLKRVEGLPETPGVYLAGGRAVHAATEAYDRQLFTMSGR